jgi:hypothetical protein
MRLERARPFRNDPAYQNDHLGANALDFAPSSGPGGVASGRKGVNGDRVYDLASYSSRSAFDGSMCVAR